MAGLLLRGGAAGRGGGRVRSGVRPRRGRGAADRPGGRARVRAAAGVLVDIAGADARTAVRVRGRAAGDRTAGAAAGREQGDRAPGREGRVTSEAAATKRSAPARGADVLVRAMEALGATAVCGVPGTHALAIWDALRQSPIASLGTRTELNAGFAADGYARASGRVAPLLLSTGPGALNSLTALMESGSAHVPVVAISSQIPRELIGRGRGFLHDLPDQRASFAPIVKRAWRAESAAGLADLLAEAWRTALAPPSGPVYLEVPVDVLDGPAGSAPLGAPNPVPHSPPLPPAKSLAAAAELLNSAERAVIWAGGGAERSGAWAELLALAQRLHAPVATTYMGKGAFPADHPLALGSACDDAAYQELLAGADLVLCVGTELGAETTGQYKLRLSGR